jgi:SAM-dependent methyltransferase
MELPRLPVEEDLWGRIVRDYYHGGTEPVVIRRDDGYGESSPRYPGDYFLEPPEEEQRLLRGLGQRVLDIGCGPGRHSLWLQRCGHEVASVDVSPGALQVAKERGCVRVLCADAMTVDLPERSLDAVTLMANGMGIGGTEQGTIHLLSGLWRLTSPGGRLLGSARDPLGTEIPEHLAYHARNREAGLPPGQIHIRLEYQKKATDWFPLLLLERERAERLLLAAGWRPVEWHEGPGGGAYHVVAEKHREVPCDG